MVDQSQRKPGEQVFWPKVVLKKWLSLRSKDTKFNADEDDGDGQVDEQEENSGGADEIADESLDAASYRLRRRNSETMRAQYINTKELRICIGTYNAAGRSPADGLDIAEWLGTRTGEQADMYVLGFQEVVPLSAGNVLGAENGRPAMAWEGLIRDTLTRTQPSTSRPKYRYHSHPNSPTRGVGPDELFPGGTDTETDDDTPFSFPTQAEEYVAPTLRKLCDMEDSLGDRDEQQPIGQQRTLLRTLSRTDRIGLAWPEQPLDLLAMSTASPSSSLSSFKSFRSFGVHRPFMKSRVPRDDGPAMVAELEDALRGKKNGSRSPFVRIVSKQMVGLFLTIWVRRGLRRCVHNLKVSTVGVGAMGYIGSKGAVSASMSVYQTMFCFVCSHLSAGERPGDLLKRNADVQEIHRRTRFARPGGLELPRDIYDHERIFWLGDLNYRIDVPYDRVHGLVTAMDWSQLAEKDQLKRELRKARAFDGWNEGVLEFAPTYKYEIGSGGNYIGDDQKGGRRTPAWCDRVLSFGKGVRLLSYGRSELAPSDHMPVAATYAVEVEVFCGRKLQKALTLTNAEVETGEVVVLPDLEF